MAKQDPNPPPWDASMSDGCSGVPNYYYGDVCEAHDEEYHWGGTVEDKLAADDRFYIRMCNKPGIAGFLARNGWAIIRYRAIRWFTHNYPPGHEMRHENSLKTEAWNWKGPGYDPS